MIHIHTHTHHHNKQKEKNKTKKIQNKFKLFSNWINSIKLINENEPRTVKRRSSKALNKIKAQSTHTHAYSCNHAR